MLDHSFEKSNYLGASRKVHIVQFIFFSGIVGKHDVAVRALLSKAIAVNGESEYLRQFKRQPSAASRQVSRNMAFAGV